MSKEVKQNKKNTNDINNNLDTIIEQKRINVLCLISMILSIVGLILIYILGDKWGVTLSISSIILGIVGIAIFVPEKEIGKKMGIAGIIIGILILLIAIG